MSMPAGHGSPARSASSIFQRAGGEVSCSWQECRTKKKALRPKPEGLRAPLSERRAGGLGSGFRAGRRGDFRFGPAEPAHGVGAHAPEDGDLRGLSLLGLAVLALVLGADKLSVNKDMVAFVQRVRDGLAEAVEDDDAVPLSSGLPLVVRVLPRLLRGDGQHGEIRAVAADLPLLRVLAEEADELDVIEIHDLFLHFCPTSLGHPRAEWILLPRRAAAFREGPKRFRGRNRESRRREAAGRRNYPEAVPRERSGGNGSVVSIAPMLVDSAPTGSPGKERTG